MSADSRKFRGAPWRILVLCATRITPVIALAACLGIISRRLNGHTQVIRWSDALIWVVILAAATLAITAFIWLIGIIWYVEVGAAGLRLTTYAGGIRRIAWSDVASAVPTTVSGLPYLLITTRPGGQQLYLALWLAGKDDLAPYIQRYAARDSPLSQWLEPAAAERPA